MITKKLTPLLLATSLAGPALGLAGCARPAPPPPLPPLAAEPTVGQEIAAVADNKVEVTFAEGSMRLSPDAGRKLDAAARLFRDVNPVMMFSIGYADAVGDELNNIVLSAKRAGVVKTALVARGIPADRVMLQAFGESDPANTADPRAAENRRVVIKWRIV